MSKIHLSYLFLLIFILITPALCTAAVEFPPAEGAYTGDYIYITEPGRYTLEHPISHQYPIGVIIAAPSVILDGQGYSIHPASSGSSRTAGIWICLTDTKGNPVTGITIRNLTIDGEGHGVYAEGTDSSLFSWGKDRSSDQAAIAAAKTPRSVTLSDMSVTGCGEGVILNGQTGVRIADMNVSGSLGSGITIREGQAQIIRCIIAKSGKSGIHLSGGSGSEISSSVISENVESGIRLEKTSDVTITDNILDNAKNLDAGPDSSGIKLATARKEAPNVVGGRVSGGNYWTYNGASLPVASGAGDKDGDGIADRPYEPVAGVTDPFPLLKPGDVITNGILTVNNDVTPPQPPEPVPVPVETPASTFSGVHAVIISDTIPPEMTPGSSYQVVLNLFNDGSDDWIDQYQMGIMALDDTAKYGPAWMTAPVSGPVDSGKTQAIPFTFRAPGQPGSYTLRYQAAREGAGLEVLYGRPYTKTITVK